MHFWRAVRFYLVVSGIIFCLSVVLHSVYTQTETTFHQRMTHPGSGLAYLADDPIESEQRTYRLGRIIHTKTVMRNGTVIESGLDPNVWVLGFSAVMGALGGFVALLVVEWLRRFGDAKKRLAEKAL